MNIDNLKCFILVAENLSFARAAEALYISQPAVTKQINTLEQELGTSLFIRSTRHVELTPAGMSFYKDAKDIVLKSQLAIERVQRQSITSDSIRIGLSNHIALFHLHPILEQFHNEYPDIYTNIEVLGYKIILNLFLEDKLDIIFYYKENMTHKQSVNFKELKKDSLSCLIPSNHPLRTKDKIIIDDLTDKSIIVCNPLNAPISIASFQQKLLEQYSVNNIIYCDSVEVLHCMVASGYGIAIIPSMLCMKSSDFSVIPLDYKTQLSFGIFYKKRNTNTALMKFLKIVDAD